MEPHSRTPSLDPAQPSSQSQPRSRASSPGERVIPQVPSRKAKIAAHFAASFIGCLGRSLRWDVDDLSGLFMNPERKEPVIVALWHNQLGLALASYHRHYNPLRPHRRLATMVSASRDGGFLAHAMQLMNLHPIRGSSSRRGAQALREFISAARQGFDLAITPDGPRGPRYKVQDGVLAAAQLTGLPIVPAVHRAHPAYTIHSWDQFQIPYPFARCRVTFGPPIHVPRNCTEDQRQSLRQHLENELLREPI